MDERSRSAALTDSNDVGDGRRLRRERGRRAVVDAMIDLVLEDEGPPAADQVAARAGVSQASLYRYFATLDDLRREGISRYFERFDDLIAIPAIGEGTLTERVERFVAARDAFYATTAPMARLARSQTADVDELAQTLTRVRSTFSDQVAQQFAPELSRVANAQRRRRIAVIATVTSFEAWDQLAVLSDTARRRALRDAVTALLN